MRINKIWSKFNNFREMKSGPVTFLGFLNLKLYRTTETTYTRQKRRVRAYWWEKKACKQVRHVGAQVRIDDEQGV